MESELDITDQIREIQQAEQETKRTFKKIRKGSQNPGLRTIIRGYSYVKKSLQNVKSARKSTQGKFEEWINSFDSDATFNMLTIFFENRRAC